MDLKSDSICIVYILNYWSNLNLQEQMLAETNKALRSKVLIPYNSRSDSFVIAW